MLGHKVFAGVGAAEALDEGLDHAVGFQGGADDLLVEIADVVAGQELVYGQPEAFLDFVGLHGDLAA